MVEELVDHHQVAVDARSLCKGLREVHDGMVPRGGEAMILRR